MIRGSCLCGGVKFEIECALGPFEFCHCTRCRKVSGSAYSRCGSPVTNPSKAGEARFEIPAGAVDDDPVVRPDKHIYMEFMAPWDRVTDDLPQLTKRAIQASRS